MIEPPERPTRNGVLYGFVLGLGLQVAQIALTALWLASFFLIGLTQLIYIVPVVIYFWRDGRRETAYGVIIAASLVALLNAACFAMFSKL